MNPTEIAAANALLNKTVRITIPAPFLCRLFKKYTIDLKVKFITGQQLLRMSRLFNRLKLDIKKLQAGDLAALFNAIAENEVLASRIIAAGMVQSWFAYRFLVPFIAWYLRSHMRMRTMAELTKALLAISDGQDFMSIIRSIAKMNIMAPNLSHKGTES